MARYILTESDLRSIIRDSIKKQLGTLNEAADSFFSSKGLDNKFNRLVSQGWSYKAIFSTIRDYCDRHLGLPDGEGSSRVAYQIDDNRVLKLAKNKKGLAQNKAEAACYMRSTSNNDLFPKIFDTSDNGLWIDCEFVLPAKGSDFLECTNYDWDEFTEIVSDLSDYPKLSPDNYYKKWLDKLVNTDYLIAELFQYIVKDGAPVGDVRRIENWGMTNRNGTPRMVLLDSGLTWNILKDFYWRPTSSSY